MLDPSQVCQHLYSNSLTMYLTRRPLTLQPAVSWFLVTNEALVCEGKATTQRRWREGRGERERDRHAFNK